MITLHIASSDIVLLHFVMIVSLNVYVINVLVL